MLKNRSLLALGGLLTLFVGATTLLSFGCGSTVDLGLSIGIDSNESGDDTQVDTADDADGTTGDLPVDVGTTEEESVAETQTDGPDDATSGGAVGDATCLTVTSTESESSQQCSTGPCGSIQWQNDCGEPVVVLLLDAGRERVLQNLAIMPGGVGFAFVEPEDFADGLAYGIVTGLDGIDCTGESGCSVAELIDRGLLDLDQLVAIDVN